MKKILGLIFALMLAVVCFALPVSAEGCIHSASYCLVCNEQLQLPDGCRWDNETKTLEMNDAYVYVSERIAFMLPPGSALKLSGENIVECKPGQTYMTSVSCTGELILTGFGSLEGYDSQNGAMYMNEPIITADGVISVKDCCLLNDASITVWEGKHRIAITNKIILGQPLKHSDGDHAGWQPFANDGTALAGTRYLYLTEDTELSETLKIVYSEKTGVGTTVNLCLNGYTLSLAEGVQGSVINVSEATLNICDCSEAGTGTITGGNTVGISDPSNSQSHANPGGAIHLVGCLNIYGCTITGNKAYWGGAIHASGGIARTKLFGTKIIGNEAEYGSAIYSSERELLLDGCVISENKGKYTVSIHYSSSLSCSAELKDTVITGNEGSGVWTSIEYGFTISGNTVIKDNDSNLCVRGANCVYIENFTGPEKAIGITYDHAYSRYNNAFFSETI